LKDEIEKKPIRKDGKTKKKLKSTWIDVTKIN
jgi:hypothetical protein